MNLKNKFDDFFINLINKKMSSKFLDKFMYKVTNLGGAIFCTILSAAILLYGLLFNSNILNLGLELLLVLAITQTIVHIIKVTVRRLRPYVVKDDINTFNIIMRDFSFPSGHTVASFSIATVIYLNYPFMFVIMYIYAMIIGVSRIYLGVHYPTDVLFGIFLGIFLTFFIHNNIFPEAMILIKNYI